MLTTLVIICVIVGALLYAHYNGSPWPGGRKFDLGERKPGETDQDRQRREWDL
jgi:hypothetical protein